LGQVELLRSNRSFRLLFVATVGSLLGTWLATIALTVEIKDETNSGLWVAALLVSLFLPAVVVGFTAGPLVDRLERRRLMVACDLVRAGLFCALPFVHSPGAVVALGGATGVANGLFKPAVKAGLPNLLDQRDLERGNALFETAENIAWAIGPLIGGAIVATAGADAAYWINAASFVASALLIRMIAASRLQSEQAASQGHWHDLKEGFSLLRSSPAVQTVVATWSVFMVASACIEVGEVFIAKNSFDAGDFGFGLLFGVGGLGLAAGSLAGGALVRGRAIGPFYAPAIAMTGVGYLLASVAPNVWVALPAVLFGGIGNGAAALFNVLLIQRGVVDRLRGRAFTVAMGLTYSVLGLAMAVAGPLTSALGGRWVWAIGGMFCLLSSAVAFALVPRLREPVHEDEPELEHAKAAAL